MSQSLVKNLLHLVYSTKHRQAWIPDDVRERMYAYQAGIYKQCESPALVIGGVEDHTHALFSLSKNYALKKIVEEVKKASSKWMKAEGSGNKDFHWQNGYAAFSVSPSNVDEVRRYIERQRERHGTLTFQDELRASIPTRTESNTMNDTPGIEHVLVAPFQGLVSLSLVTQGGAALCPGLICRAPSGLSSGEHALSLKLPPAHPAVKPIAAALGHVPARIDP